MRRLKKIQGFIDPLSLFAVVFLLATLAVGTYVTTNRGISLNIAEKASETTGDLGGYLPPNSPTCTPKCDGKTCGDNGCGGLCGSCSPGYYCSNSTCFESKAPSSLPTAVPTSGNGYDLDTAIDSSNNIPGTAGYDCRKGGCPPGSSGVSGYYLQNGKYYAIGGTGNDPARYNENRAPVLTQTEARIAQSDCKTIGGTYDNISSICYKSETSTTKEKTDDGFITHTTTILRDLNTGKILNAQTYDTTIDTRTFTSRDEDLEGRGNNTKTVVQSLVNVNTGEVIANQVSSYIVKPNPIAQVNNRFSTFRTKEECQATRVPGTRGYNECSSFSTSEEKIRNAFEVADTLTFGLSTEYALSYSPDKVEYNWEIGGYESAEECKKDILKSGNAFLASTCGSYQITKEQLSSSIKLGTALTAEAALVTTGAGWGTGLVTGTQALTTGLAISTLYQTGTATSTCVIDVTSGECKTEAFYAIVSLANLGSAAFLEKAVGSAIATAKYINTAVNIANIGVDVWDAKDACIGENASGLGCTIGVGATLLDLGGGVFDIANLVSDSKIAKSNLAELADDINGWPSDIPPVKSATNLTNEIPSASTIDDLTLAIIPDSPTIPVNAIDNAIADISFYQITDTPHLGEINSSNITSTADDLLAELPTSLESEINLLAISDSTTPTIASIEPAQAIDIEKEIAAAKIQAQEIIDDPSFQRVKEKAKVFKNADASEKAILTEHEIKLKEIRNEYITATTDEMTLQQRAWGKASRDARTNGLPTPRLQYNKLTEVVMSIPNESSSFKIEDIARAADRYDYQGNLEDLKLFFESKGGSASRRDIVEFAADLELGINAVANIPTVDTPIAIFMTSPALNWFDQKVLQPVENFVSGDKLLFGDTALLPTGGGTYQSLGGQKLLIKPASDPSLQYYLQGARLYLGENRLSQSVSRVDLLNEYVHNSTKYAYPGSDQIRNNIYLDGKAMLGDFTDAKTGVCREFAACLHVALADNGKESYMTIGDINLGANPGSNQGGRHAWVEYIDSKTGQWMVADPTQGFVMNRDQAYSQKYITVENVKREVFVWPTDTPLWRKVSKKIEP